jgi:hypothetical protein
MARAAKEAARVLLVNAGVQVGDESAAKKRAVKVACGTQNKAPEPKLRGPTRPQGYIRPVVLMVLIVAQSRYSIPSPPNHRQPRR